MRLVCTYIFLTTLFLGQSAGGPLIDPTLVSLIKTNSVSNCEVLVKFRGPLTKNLWKNKLIKKPARALNYIKEKFADDFLLRNFNLRKIFWLNHTILMELNLDQLRKLQTRSDVDYIALNREITIPASKTHKQTYSKTIKDSESISHALKTLQIPQVWNHMNVKGKSLRIGFLGRSFSPHPDLKNETILFRDFTEGTESSQITQDDTQFLGLMGAGSLSGRALGVAPDARFIVAGVFNRQNTTTLGTILQALQWMINPDLNPNTEDGAQIISNSWGDTVHHMGAEKPIWDATVALKKMGIINIFPAGDYGPQAGSILSPGAYPHVIAVGAIDRQLNRLEYSSRGPIKWEDVSYSKPDFFAPGDQIESLLPSSIYGKMSGTSAATALAAGSLALIKQSNPKLPWHDVLKISKQTTLLSRENIKKLHDNPGVLQVYDAALLAKFGAKISVHVEGPHNGEIHITLLDGHHKFKTTSMGFAEFFLIEGNHKIAISAKGFAPKVQEINVKPTRNQTLRIKLEKSEIKNLVLTVHDPQGQRLPATIEFLNNLGQTFVGITEPMQESLPEGIYPVKIKSRGFKSITTSIIHRRPIHNKRLQLNVMPSIALIDDDGKRHSDLHIARSLHKTGIKYDLIHPPKDLEEIEAYQLLIWHLGATVHRTISESEQLLLTKYVRRGGSLLISGQDSAYSLQSTQFLNKTLGVEFEKDHSGSLDVKYKEFDLQLYGKGSAQNQFFVDALKPNSSESQCYVRYNNGMCAGVLRYHPKGKSIVLGFGLEGLPDIKREFLLNKIIKDLKPAIEHLLDKIERAYLNNRVSYFQMMKSLETFEPEFAQKASQHIELRRRKSAWRPLLYDILHDRRRHIFDQLYNID